MSNELKGDRRRRVGVAVATAIASLVAFAAVGGVGIAQSAINLVQYQYGKKVTICHKGKNTITVSVNAWKAHERHGDQKGTCAQVRAKKAKAAAAVAAAAKKQAAQAAAKAAKHGSGSAASAKGNGGKGNGNGKGNAKH